MAFCNQLPELFRFATPEIKREIVQTCVRTLKTLIIPNKKAPEGANFNYGAPDGIVLLGGVKRQFRVLPS